VTLPFDEAGSGPANVVLLHAGVADRTMWAEHLEPIAAEGYRVVALDLPGFGEAPPPVGSQAPWIDVLGTMRDLGIDQAALVGNSFGGGVALRASVVAPAAVWAMVLISAPAPGLEPSAELLVAWEREEAALERGDIDGAVEAVLDSWVRRDLRDRVGPMQRRALKLQSAGEDITEAPDPVESLDVLRGLEVPTLLAWGEHDMQDFKNGAHELAAALPNAWQEEIKAAGHLAPLETPDAFRTLVVSFLREVGG
jgi:3-oxoadipate enol-lactonase